MGLTGIFKSLFSSGKTDISARYEILREAISGTMSKFYKARDRQTGEIVGLKVLDREKTRAFEGRFKGLEKPSEGEIAVAIRHPRVVKTFEHGITTDDEAYLVMEYLDGPGLNSLVTAQSKELDGRRLRLVRQMAESLAAVHAAGFIHRDVCPRNFVVDQTFNSLKLIDFGLTVPAKREFMQPGNRTGTPNYMSPEIVRRKTTDHRVDIFAFGATAYELFTFQLPWLRGTDGQAAMSHGDDDIVGIEEYAPDIHPQLSRAIMRCLATNPAERPASMDHFLQSIRLVEGDRKAGEPSQRANP